MFPVASVDLHRCDDYLRRAPMSVRSGLIEQTLHALCASAQGHVGYLPGTYVISLDGEVELGGVVARHYAGASLRLLTEEGMPALIAIGLLQRWKEAAAECA